MGLGEGFRRGGLRIPAVKTTNGEPGPTALDFGPFVPLTCVNQRPRPRNREIISARHELKCIMTNILQSLQQTDVRGGRCPGFAFYPILGERKGI